MKVKFSKIQIKFLQTSLEETGRKDLLKYLNRDADESNYLELSEDVMCNIRDWAGERLQIIGFDKNYELTKKGKILEEIIDILYL